VKMKVKTTISCECYVQVLLKLLSVRVIQLQQLFFHCL